MRRLGVTLLISAVVGATAVTASALDRQRTNPGTTTGTAAPRGSSPSSPSSPSPSGPTTSSSSGGSMGTSRSGGESTGPSSHAVSRSRSEPGSRVNAGSGDQRAVPAYSRPRDGRTPTGTAIARADAPVTSLPIFVRYGYYPYGFGYPGYGSFGLGFNYYDPFWWGYPGYGYGSYYGGGYYTGGGYYGGRDAYRDTGGLRLKVKQRDAQVYVDGYYVGQVNDFDGVFQRLTLESGGHRVELRADGFQTLSFDVLIVSGETITYRGDLKRIP